MIDFSNIRIGLFGSSEPPNHYATMKEDRNDVEL